ncbi:MAG TPA: hypothetical protein VG167_18245 [Verrucomicrobiae bacterium]|nr:hypothetical protein [Verrucomicrobiae bacterium]
MTELELLFLVLALLYLWDCACWLRRGSAGIRTWLGYRWQVVHPGTLLGNARGGFILAAPLPPLGSVFITHQLPVSLSPEAVLAFVPSSLNPGWRPPQTGKCIGWDQMLRVEARGAGVHVNGEPLLKAATPGLAAHLADTLRTLKELPLARRQAALQKLLHESLQSRLVAQRWQEFKLAATPLRLLTNGLFLYLFIAVPLSIGHFGLSGSWPVLLAVLVAFTVTIAVAFRRLHRVFFPEAEEERFTHFLIVLLSPVSAVRALDLLSRPLLERFHPLAVAQNFCQPRQFRAFAAALLRELRHPGLPTSPAGEPRAAEAEASWRKLCLSEVESFLGENGIAPEELMRPPLLTEPGCVSYCPRCLAQFTSPTGVCQDCGGVALLRISLPAGQ